MSVEAKRNKNSRVLTKHVTLQGRNYCWRSTSCWVSLWKTGTFHKSQLTIPEFESMSMGWNNVTLFFIMSCLFNFIQPFYCSKMLFPISKRQIMFSLLDTSTDIQICLIYCSLSSSGISLLYCLYCTSLLKIFLYSSPFTDLLAKLHFCSVSISVWLYTWSCFKGPDTICIS